MKVIFDEREPKIHPWLPFLPAAWEAEGNKQIDDVRKAPGMIRGFVKEFSRMAKQQEKQGAGPSHGIRCSRTAGSNPSQDPSTSAAEHQSSGR